MTPGRPRLDSRAKVPNLKMVNALDSGIYQLKGRNPPTHVEEPATVELD
jgi:hypothetical protein